MTKLIEIMPHKVYLLGEMELTSAVRSVSCNNSNTMSAKCMNPKQSGSNVLSNSVGSLNRQSNLKHAKDDGSGHEGDDEDEYGGGHGMAKMVPTSLARYGDHIITFYAFYCLKNLFIILSENLFS